MINELISKFELESFSDIKAKFFETPIWNLLGGKVRDKIRLHLLLGIMPGNSKSKNEGLYENAKKAVKYHLNNTGVSRFVKFKYILKKIIKIKPQKNILEQWKTNK